MVVNGEFVQCQSRKCITHENGAINNINIYGIALGNA